MTSTVRFDPPGVEGLVASGTTLAAAAERLGVPIVLACGGVGECTSCAVRMLENPFALTEITSAERQHLGEARIAASERLACQSKVRSGDCVARVLDEHAGDATESAEGATPTAGAHERILEAFEELPTSDRVSTALELQLKVASDLLGAIVDVPLKAGSEFVSSIFGKSESTSARDDGDTNESGSSRGDE